MKYLMMVAVVLKLLNGDVFAAQVKTKCPWMRSEVSRLNTKMNLSSAKIRNNNSSVVKK